jgi:hypothetical protein
MERFKDRRGNKMADNVKSLRQAQLSKQASKFAPILRAYRDMKMTEHGVDLQDEQAIRAKQAMQDIFDKDTEVLFQRDEESWAVFKIELEAREREDNEMAERAASILASMDHTEEDILKSEIYFQEKMKEYGVDPENEQAQRTIRATLEVREKFREIHLTLQEERLQAACAHAELLKGTK